MKEVKPVKEHHLSDGKLFALAFVIVTVLLAWANSTKMTKTASSGAGCT